MGPLERCQNTGLEHDVARLAALRPDCTDLFENTCLSHLLTLPHRPMPCCELAPNQKGRKN